MFQRFDRLACGFGEFDRNLDRCVCHSGYTGSNCVIPFTSPLPADTPSTWRDVTIPAMTSTVTPGARLSHTAVFQDSSQSIYVFGGEDLNSLHADLWKFDLNLNAWSEVRRTVTWPAARRRHATAVISNQLFMFGGQLQNGDVSNELWMFDVSAQSWLLLTTNSDVTAPAVSGHTLTAVDEFLYVIGGSDAAGQPLRDVYRINVEMALNNLQWEQVLVRDNNAHLLARVGHSSVYHKATNTMYIFGGTAFDSAPPRLTSDVIALQLSELVVTSLSESCRDRRVADVPGFKKFCAPTLRAFHSAHLLGDTMLVLGGQTHDHDVIDTCYDDAVYLYSLSCHSWLPVADLFTERELTPLQSKHHHHILCTLLLWCLLQ